MRAAPRIAAEAKTCPFSVKPAHRSIASGGIEVALALQSRIGGIVMTVEPKIQISPAVEKAAPCKRYAKPILTKRERLSQVAGKPTPTSAIIVDGAGR
jgi:hypothetical protein